MSMKHKLFSLLFMLMAGVGTMFANYYHVNIGDLYYNLDTEKKTASLTNETDIPGNYSGMKSIDIPDTVIYNSAVYVVSYIEEKAFVFCDSLQSVTIPNTITSLAGVFSHGCSNLQVITVAADNAAYSSVDGVLFNKEQTMLIAFPGAKSGAYTIPEGVMRVCEKAFYFCSGLTDVTISNSVTSLEGAFYGCSGITAVYVPENVTLISSGEFCRCSNLTAINVAAENTAYCSIDSVLFNKTRTTLIAFPCAKSGAYSIPEGVTRISQEAFCACKNVESITIPSSVTVIAGGAFEACVSLRSITSKAITPPTCSAGSSDYGLYVNSSFYNVDRSIPVYVPAESVPAYKAASQWKDFTNIQPIAEPLVLENPVMIDGLYYNLDTINQTAEVTYEKGYDFINYQAVGSELVIPSTVEYNAIKYSVTSIGDSAFVDSYDITSFTIPNSIVRIGKSAFASCNMQTIILPDHVTVIEDSAFYSCNDLQEITLPDSLQRIGNATFSYCTVLSSVRLPEGLTTIGEDAFSYCSGLTEILLPSSLTSIGRGAFMRCISLQSITLPDKLTRIEWETFNGCSSMTSAIMGSGLTEIGNEVFSRCSSLTSVTIGPNVTDIGMNAFYGCVGLTSVTIPASVINLEALAFQNCSGLTSIVIPENVATMGTGVFRGCTGLVAITSRTITPINCGSGAFEGVDKSIPLYVPAESLDAYKAANQWKDFTDIRTIAEPQVFENPVLIDGLYFNLDTINQTAEVTYEKEDEENNYASLSGELIIPSMVEYHGRAYNVTSIGSLAFYFCSGISSVTIPNSVTELGEWAFGNCRGMTSLNLSNRITRIENSAFSYCTGLTYVTIPNSVTSIGDGAFEMCSSLAIVSCEAVTPPECGISVFDRIGSSCKLYVPSASISTYRKTVPWNDFVDIQALIDPQTIENPVLIGDLYYNLYGDNRTAKVTYQKYKATDNYAGLTTADIHAVVEYGGVFFDVVSIDDRAFHDCSSLTAVSIPNSVTNISSFAFSNCSGLTEVEIPNSVTKIGTQAFAYCTGLTSIEIPNSVTELFGSTFGGCSNLTAINVVSDNPAYYSMDGVVFNRNSQIALIAFPEGKQESYDIPKEVMHIAYDAFFNNTHLKSVTIPNSVKSIGDAAFYGCSGLTSITIPSSVELIGDWAFQNCTGLTSITSERTSPIYLTDGVFKEVNKSIPVYVPAESVEAYKAANGWKDFTDIQPIQATETTVETVVTTPTEYSVLISWPSMENAMTYTIEIKKGNETICVLVFNAQGQLMSIALAPVRNAHRINSNSQRRATQTANGWQYNISGLEANTEYSYIITTKKTDLSENVQYGSFTTTGTATGIDEQRDDMPCTKVLRNGKIFILRGDKVYTVTGQELR